MEWPSLLCSESQREENKGERERQRHGKTALELLVQFLSVLICRRDRAAPLVPSAHQMPADLTITPLYVHLPSVDSVTCNQEEPDSAAESEVSQHFGLA